MDETLPHFAVGKKGKLARPDVAQRSWLRGFPAFCLPDSLKRFDISQAPALRLNR
jgi:hypothetical protein